MNASLERVLTANPHTADATADPLTAENATVTRSDAAQTPTTPGRISREALPSASELREQLPVDVDLAGQIRQHRDEINAILAGDDDRLLVVVGPCSIHDLKAAREYAQRLAVIEPQVRDRLKLVMRVYVEKPRTTVGWKGLAYDPHLDGSDDMATGLRQARELMREITQLGLPVATELLQPLTAAYLEDLLGWAAIGARTTESQIHREMASGLGCAVGFKNGTDGGVEVAVQAIEAAAHGHRHFGMGDSGRPALIETAGNPHTHVVLRGGHGQPNYDAASVAACRRELEGAGLTPRLMVDCSHANSRKDHRRQSEVMLDVLSQRLAGDDALIGVMLESHLNEGKQALPAAEKLSQLRHGVSVTDACLGWETTEHLLSLAAERLREA
ncbi:3-deoxy-7-phosphoheptulonate synthase [Cobetia amphilecti]|uniref:Phospho-2-dehydro-3-deoxyheptonate aldolase n=1 Tax=Cobetia amphilecti TaxID=1055104 RepID=A0ABT6UPX3_9GAMM|nr:3-deoxy-7-phosphoheptulonate synthase [Cobetia amphilecti]MDI5884755.1 3-deoxy-7-phosphoheptulonate synthase [Cobetia amphilecti]